MFNGMAIRPSVRITLIALTMTSQSHADALLAAWQLLRAQGLSPELRLPVIDALCEIERVKCDTMSQFPPIWPERFSMEYT